MAAGAGAGASGKPPHRPEVTYGGVAMKLADDPLPDPTDRQRNALAYPTAGMKLSGEQPAAAAHGAAAAAHSGNGVHTGVSIEGADRRGGVVSLGAAAAHHPHHAHAQSAHALHALERQGSKRHGISAPGTNALTLVDDPEPDAVSAHKRGAVVMHTAPYHQVLRASVDSSAAHGAAAGGSTSPRKGDSPVWVVPATGSAAQLDAGVKAAAELLRGNEVVGFPTETVYGLGGNALCDSAIEKIYAAKGRPSDNPLIVHVATMEQCYSLVTGGAAGVNATAQKLMAAFWPGPLTFILPTQPGVLVARRVTGAATVTTGADGKTVVTGGQTTVGVRMPSHPVALALIRVSGVPIAAPSANRSGKPSPTTAAHVIHDLGGRIAGVVDGGPTCSIGLESTVIDCADPSRVLILRPGGITAEQLESVIGKGKVQLDPALAIKQPAAPAAAAAAAPATPAAAAGAGAGAAASGSSAGAVVAGGRALLDDGDSADAHAVAPKAPGMKYLHYAPRAPLRLVSGSDAFLQALAAAYRKRGLKVGVLTTEEKAPAAAAAASAAASGSADGKAAAPAAAAAPAGGVVFSADVVLACGRRSDLGTVARRLYDVLRAFDDTDVALILSETFPTDGLGLAVMNRLQKAAAKQYIVQPTGAATLHAAVDAAVAAAAIPLPR